MTRSRIGFAFVVTVAVAASLMGCREEEQNRVLLFDKHQENRYAGQPDTPLKAEALKAARERIAHQRGPSVAGIGGGGGGGGSSPPNIRPPAGALRQRGQQQNFN